MKFYVICSLIHETNQFKSGNVATYKQLNWNAFRILYTPRVF